MKKLFVATLLVLFCLAAVNAQELEPRTFLPLTLQNHSAPIWETRAVQAMAFVVEPYVEGSFRFSGVYCQPFDPRYYGWDGSCHVSVQNTGDSIMIIDSVVVTTTGSWLEDLELLNVSLPRAVNAWESTSIPWRYESYEENPPSPGYIVFDIEITCYWLPLGVSYEEWRIE